MYQLERGERGNFNLVENRPVLLALKMVQTVVLTVGLLAAGEKMFMQDSDEVPSTLDAEEASVFQPIEEQETTSRTLLNTTTTLREEVVVLPTTTTTLPTTTVPTTTTTLAPPQAVPLEDEPEPKPQPRLRSREQRCREAIAAANVTPAPGYYAVCGPYYNSGQDGYTCPNSEQDYNYNKDPNYTPPPCGDDNLHPGDIMQPGETRLHPDDSDSDASWVNSYKHEIGHGYCYRDSRDVSEQCADNWAATH